MTTVDKTELSDITCDSEGKTLLYMADLIMARAHEEHSNCRYFEVVEGIGCR